MWILPQNSLVQISKYLDVQEFYLFQKKTNQLLAQCVKEIILSDYQKQYLVLQKSVQKILPNSLKKSHEWVRNLGRNLVKDRTFTIGNNVIIGAGTVVTTDILKPGTYVGSPAKQLK